MPHCLYRLVVWADPCLCLPGKIRRETYAGLPYYNREECLHCARSKKHVPTVNDLEEGVRSAYRRFTEWGIEEAEANETRKLVFEQVFLRTYTGKGLRMTSKHTRVFRHQPRTNVARKSTQQLFCQKNKKMPMQIRFNKLTISLLNGWTFIRRTSPRVANLICANIFLVLTRLWQTCCTTLHREAAEISKNVCKSLPLS